jgi:hypothetical protein
MAGSEIWTKETYEKYLKSRHWWWVRRWKLVRSVAETAPIEFVLAIARGDLDYSLLSYPCEDCGRNFFPQFLSVHHLTYERLGHEMLTDLKVLCLACHATMHGKKPPPWWDDAEERGFDKECGPRMVRSLGSITREVIDNLGLLET